MSQVSHRVLPCLKKGVHLRALFSAGVKTAGFDGRQSPHRAPSGTLDKYAARARRCGLKAQAG